MKEFKVEPYQKLFRLDTYVGVAELEEAVKTHVVPEKKDDDSWRPGTDKNAAHELIKCVDDDGFYMKVCFNDCGKVRLWLHMDYDCMHVGTIVQEDFNVAVMMAAMASHGWSGKYVDDKGNEDIVYYQEHWDNWEEDDPMCPVSISLVERDWGSGWFFWINGKRGHEHGLYESKDAIRKMAELAGEKFSDSSFPIFVNDGHNYSEEGAISMDKVVAKYEEFKEQEKRDE